MLLFLPVCSHSKVEFSHGEVEGSTGFLKSPKALAQDSVPCPTPKPFPSWLMPRQKDILSVAGGPVAERIHSSMSSVLYLWFYNKTASRNSGVWCFS